MIQIKEKTMEFEQNERICNEVQELKISMERRMNVCDIEVEELRWAVVLNQCDSYYMTHTVYSELKIITC